jgi:hypothetical protein
LHTKNLLLLNPLYRRTPLTPKTPKTPQPPNTATTPPNLHLYCHQHSYSSSYNLAHTIEFLRNRSVPPQSLQWIQEDIFCFLVYWDLVNRSTVMWPICASRDKNQTKVGLTRRQQFMVMITLT